MKLAEVPTTQLRAVVLCACIPLTIAGCFLMMWFGKDINEAILLMIFAVEVGEGGWIYKQFRAKRETFRPEADTKERRESQEVSLPVKIKVEEVKP